MAAFRRRGDRRLLGSAFAPDLRFPMAGHVERRGRDYFATRLAHDFEYGVIDRPLRVIPGEHLAITELPLDSPPEQPLTARPPSPSADQLPLT
jgi:hypothetical protein